MDWSARLDVVVASSRGEERTPGYRTSQHGSARPPTRRWMAPASRLTRIDNN